MVEISLQSRRITLSMMVAIVGVAAVLYVAKDIFLPLAIAMLVTFALSPLATRLRKLGLPRLVSVLAVVAVAFVAIALFCLVVISQLSQLAQNLPSFQANIVAKVEGLQAGSDGSGVVSRLSKMVYAINDKIGAAVGPAKTEAAPAGSDKTGSATAEPRPMPVEVVQSRSPFQLLLDLVLPLVSPVATIGLVIVLVIFMLLEREELRDRFIRLVGSTDIHRTTLVLEEAGSRVGTYLLIQLLVNVIYAVPIGVGLWLIGVPNAPLWGLLTLVLRFVPYIGPVLSAAFPLFLSFAIAKDWSAVLWTLALFGVVELVTSNVIEPWLYGSRTGVSPLAIIIAAIFWTFLWGPLGLVLSTPLTVCLVVLGRHVPQFEVFDILFGDEPVLAPPARLYQRLLAGDPMEATFRAEEELEEMFIADYYRDIGIPALLLAQHDLARGVLTPEQQDRLADVATAMVDDLATVVAGERATLENERVAEDGADGQASAVDPDGQGFRIACVGGRTRLDDVSAAMLSQAMAAEGADSVARNHADLSPSRIAGLIPQGTDCLLVTFLDSAPSRASLLHVRRTKRAIPGLRVGIVIWQAVIAEEDSLTWQGQMLVSDVKRAEATEIGADFVATTVEEAMAQAFIRAKPVPVPDLPRRAARSGRARPRIAAA